MVKSYNTHGREQSGILQLTCDSAVADEFKQAVKRSNIKPFTYHYDPQRLFTLHLAYGD